MKNFRPHKTEADFHGEANRLNELGAGDFVDPAVTLENLWEVSRESEAFWDRAFFLLREEAAQRMLDSHVDPECFGLTHP